MDALLNILMSNGMVQKICTWVYTNILKTKQRAPVFIISMHIYLTKLLFDDYTGPNSLVICYLALMGSFCLIWESVYSILAVRTVKSGILADISFLIFDTTTKFVNLVTIGLFATSGLPLTYIMTNYSQLSVIILVSLIFVINYLFDLIEQKIWGDKYWSKLIAKSNDIESRVLTEIGQDKFNDLTIKLNGSTSNQK